MIVRNEKTGKLVFFNRNKFYDDESFFSKIYDFRINNSLILKDDKQKEKQKEENNNNNNKSFSYSSYLITNFIDNHSNKN